VRDPVLPLGYRPWGSRTGIDVVATQEQSLMRILFGGKSTVTVRELSRLAVREEILPTGATLSVHELSGGHSGQCGPATPPSR
jgi:hypothetical protein